MEVFVLSVAMPCGYANGVAICCLRGLGEIQAGASKNVILNEYIFRKAVVTVPIYNNTPTSAQFCIDAIYYSTLVIINAGNE
jgi:hypothetical protein